MHNAIQYSLVICIIHFFGSADVVGIDPNSIVQVPIKDIRHSLILSLPDKSFSSYFFLLNTGGFFLITLMGSSTLSKICSPIFAAGS